MTGFVERMKPEINVSINYYISTQRSILPWLQEQFLALLCRV